MYTVLSERKWRSYLGLVGRLICAKLALKLYWAKLTSFSVFNNRVNAWRIKKSYTHLKSVKLDQNSYFRKISIIKIFLKYKFYI